MNKTVYRGSGSHRVFEDRFPFGKRQVAGEKVKEGKTQNKVYRINEVILYNNKAKNIGIAIAMERLFTILVCKRASQNAKVISRTSTKSFSADTITNFEKLIQKNAKDA